MRELEFVPQWYPRMQRRRSWLKVQCGLTLVVMVILGAWMIEARANIAGKRDLLGQTETKLSQSSEELNLLAEQVALKEQLQQQKLIMERVGRHVDSSRMLSFLEQSLTAQMSIVQLKMDTVESIRKQGGLETDGRGGTSLDRQLQVTVTGVAPTDLDISEFLERLSKVRFCDNVQLVEASDLSRDGHRMRKFEVTFRTNLGEGELQ